MTEPKLRPSDITPEELVQAHKSSRRSFLKSAALTAAGAAGFGGGLITLSTKRGVVRPPDVSTLPALSVTPASSSAAPFAASLAADDELTSVEDITTYNNFSEFGLDKGDPAENAGSLKVRPWSVVVDGEVEAPKTFDIDRLMSSFPLEERVYRMRCVEAWSMVIPWLGLSLGALIRSVNPTSRAKFVQFTTLLDREQMPGQRTGVLDWPYREGLRMDEALHPLSLLAVGLYGRTLPNQNGAPIRLVVPWKYGFKGSKSIVRITLTEKQPPTTWNSAAASEYGFYANVNPSVPHPRWSQASERRIGDLTRRPTLPFNGYAADVAELYAGMDLAKYF